MKKSWLLILALFLTGCGENSESQSVESESVAPSETPSESTSIVTKYHVNFTEDERYSISSEKDFLYEENEEVVLTIHINDDGYSFTSLNADVDVSFTYSVNENSDNVVKFTMPGQDINIQVNLESHLVELLGVSNYSTDISSYEFDNLKFKKGETRKITLLPAGTSFYSGDENKMYVQIGSEIYHPSMDYTESTEYADTMSLSFAVPEDDFSICISSAYNAISDSGYTVTLEENPYITLLGHKPGEKYSRFSGKLLRKTGYEVSSIRYQYANSSEWHDIDCTGYYAFKIDNLKSLYDFYSLANDVTIVVEGEYTGVRKINYVGLNAVKPYSSTDTFYTEATTGDAFSINYKASAEYTLNGLPIFEGLSEDGITSNRDGYFSITIPENDITIAFSATKNNKITVENNEFIESYTVTNNTTREESFYCAPYGTFTLQAKPVSGRVLKSATVYDENGKPAEPVTAIDNSVTLRMPASGDCTVRLEVVEGRTLEAIASENGTISFSRSTYLAGDDVLFSIRTTNLYQLFDLQDQNGDSISFELTSSTSGHFTMPDRNLVITPVFYKKPVRSVSLVIDEVSSIASLTIRGNESSVSISQMDNSGEFLIGETLYITGYYNDANMSNLIVYVTEEGTERLVERGFFNHQVQVTEGLTQIRIAALVSE